MKIKRLEDVRIKVTPHTLGYIGIQIFQVSRRSPQAAGGEHINSPTTLIMNCSFIVSRPCLCAYGLQTIRWDDYLLPDMSCNAGWVKVLSAFSFLHRTFTLNTHTLSSFYAHICADRPSQTVINNFISGGFYHKGSI